MAKKYKKNPKTFAVPSCGCVETNSPEEMDTRQERERFERDQENVGHHPPVQNHSAPESRRDLADIDASAFNSSSPAQPKETDVTDETTFRRQARSNRLPTNEYDKEEFDWS